MRTLLLRVILPVVFPLLACAGTPLSGMAVFVCPTVTPNPTPAPGEPLPLPTPFATPYRVTAPQDFHIGDTVTLGLAGTAQAIRWRVYGVADLPAPDAGRAVHLWMIEIHNAGTAEYTVFPAVQMALVEVGGQTGAWFASAHAATLAGIQADLDLYTLAPGETRAFHLAAFAPFGVAHRWRFALDPLTPEGDAITWTHQPNPHCPANGG